MYLRIPSSDYRDQNTRDNTFDQVIKTIDTKTKKSVGMIIVMPSRIVANVNLIPCPALQQPGQLQIVYLDQREYFTKGMRLVILDIRTFDIVTVCCLVDPVLSL